MFNNFEKFIYSSIENFPQKECVIKDRRENGVYNSDEIYQVLYIDIRFPREKMITYAKPYIYTDECGDVSFGWVSMNTSEVFGNVENSCKLWDEFVIGFIPVNESYIKDDTNLFEKYKKIIESQYD